MAEGGTLLLTRSATGGLLDAESVADGIEVAFRARGAGHGLPLIREHLPGRGGAFHVVAGTVELDEPWFTTKVNAHFERPSGVTALFSGADGRLVALLDSAYLTAMRTAAMTVVVVRNLAPREVRRVLVVGAGRQGATQARILRRLLPGLTRLALVDTDGRAAARVAAECGGTAVEDLAAAADDADLIVTTTPSREPFLQAGMVRDGTVICAYGADAPGKQEVALDLLVRSCVVVDVKSQALVAGELQHAVVAGLDEVVDAAQELGSVLTDQAWRCRDGAVVIYDATGTAVQDAVAASQLVAAAERARRGIRVVLDD